MFSRFVVVVLTLDLWILFFFRDDEKPPTTVHGETFKGRFKEKLEHAGHVVGEFGSTVKDKIHPVVEKIKVYMITIFIW